MSSCSSRRTGRSRAASLTLAILNGKYSIPVPMAAVPLFHGAFFLTLLALYEVSIEAVDGTPVAAASISFTTQIGNFFGQQNFNEERWNRRREASLETSPGDDSLVLVLAGKKTGGINIRRTRRPNISNFGALNFIGFINSPGGRYYAVRIPASQIAAVNPGQDILVQSAMFNSFVVDASWRRSGPKPC